MTYKTITRSVSLLAIAGLLPAALMAAENVPSKSQMEKEKEGIELIRQVEEVSRDLVYNAGRLNSFKSNILISHWTHVHHLDQIKELVNNGLRPAIVRLTEIQPELPAWKQESIDRLFGAAKAVTADMNSAYLTRQDAAKRPPVLDQEYKALVSQIYGHAQTLVTTSDAAETFATSLLAAEEAGLKVRKQ